MKGGRKETGLQACAGIWQGMAGAEWKRRRRRSEAEVGDGIRLQQAQQI